MGTQCYAYQVALKTLKERCDHLQNKLELMEEENSQLKLQIIQENTMKSPRSSLDVDQLRLQISSLVEQKAKLNDHIRLVTTENQKLWSRLSKIASDNDVFESNVSVKEDSLRCLERNGTGTESHSDLEIAKVALTPEGFRGSLEEISLKLSALIMEKKEPEFPSTIDLFVYKNQYPIENCGFSTVDDNESLLNSVKNHILKLKQFKQILQNNKNDLNCAITLFKNFQKNSLCNECGKTFTQKCDENASVLFKTSDVEEQGKDMATIQAFEASENVCPLCAATFSGSFLEFEKHVGDHFFDEGEEATTFEIIP